MAAAAAAAADPDADADAVMDSNETTTHQGGQRTKIVQGGPKSKPLPNYK